jgi:hypothetical protein
MQWLRTILVLALVLTLLWAGWTFRAGNAGEIDVDLVWLRVPNVAIWWALVGAAGVGASLGAFTVGFAWLRQRILNRRYRRAIERLESEVHQLRSLPLAGSLRAEPAPTIRPGSIGQG